MPFAHSIFSVFALTLYQHVLHTSQTLRQVLDDLGDIWYSWESLNLTIPSFGVPTFVAVALQMPTYDNLEFSLPVVRLPDFSSLTINATLPNFNVPAYSIPTFDVPTLDVSKLRAPSFALSPDLHLQGIILSGAACAAASLLYRLWSRDHIHHEKCFCNQLTYGTFFATTPHTAEDSDRRKPRVVVHSDLSSDLAWPGDSEDERGPTKTFTTTPVYVPPTSEASDHRSPAFGMVSPTPLALSGLRSPDVQGNASSWFYSFLGLSLDSGSSSLGSCESYASGHSSIPPSDTVPPVQQATSQPVLRRRTSAAKTQVPRQVILDHTTTRTKKVSRLWSGSQIAVISQDYAVLLPNHRPSPEDVFSASATSSSLLISEATPLASGPTDTPAVLQTVDISRILADQEISSQIMDESFVGLESFVVPPTPTPISAPTRLSLSISSTSTENSEDLTPNAGEICITVTSPEQVSKVVKDMISPVPLGTPKTMRPILDHDQLLSPNAAATRNPGLIVTPGRVRAPTFIALPDTPAALATASSNLFDEAATNEPAPKEKHWRKKRKQDNASLEDSRTQTQAHTADRPNWALAPDDDTSVAALEPQFTKSRTASLSSNAEASVVMAFAPRTRKHTADAPDWALAPEESSTSFKRQADRSRKIGVQNGLGPVQQRPSGNKPVRTEAQNWVLARADDTTSSKSDQRKIRTGGRPSLDSDWSTGIVSEKTSGRWTAGSRSSHPIADRSRQSSGRIGRVDN